MGGNRAITQEARPKNVELDYALLTGLLLFTVWSSIGEFVMLPTEPRV
jgi:hypothetical protein